jgi:hypothetical protein
MSMLFGTPRFWLWACRNVPLVVGSAWLYALIFTNAFTPQPPVSPLQVILAPDTLFDGFGTALIEMALVLLLVSYVLVVFIVLQGVGV